MSQLSNVLNTIENYTEYLYDDIFNQTIDYENKIEEISNLNQEKEESIIIEIPEEKQFIQRKRKEKNKNNSPRGDNIAKQTKVHAFQFLIHTINKLLEKKNSVKFQNRISKMIKDRVQKEFNLNILNKSCKEILKYNENINDDAITSFEKNFENNQSNENLILINNILNMKFQDLIKTYGISNESFIQEYRFHNKYLLANLNIKNKVLVRNLIEYGIDKYYGNKKERKLKKKNQNFYLVQSLCEKN